MARFLERLIFGKREKKNGNGNEVKTTSSAELRRIEQTQKELNSKLDVLEGRIERIEHVLVIPVEHEEEGDDTGTST